MTQPPFPGNDFFDELGAKPADLVVVHSYVEQTVGTGSRRVVCDNEGMPGRFIDQLDLIGWINGADRNSIHTHGK